VTPAGSVEVMGLEWIVVVKLLAKRTFRVLRGIVGLILSFETWTLGVPSSLYSQLRCGGGEIRVRRVVTPRLDANPPSASDYTFTSCSF